jgi:excisionase family DNA binding protein
VSLFDETALRLLIAEELRRVIREELPRAGGGDEFVPVAEAARIVAVTPDTIRAWIHQRKLEACWAGRELRIRRSELHRLLTTPPKLAGEPSPEEEARLFLARREGAGMTQEQEGRRAAPVRKRSRDPGDGGE